MSKGLMDWRGKGPVTGLHESVGQISWCDWGFCVSWGFWFSLLCERGRTFMRSRIAIKKTHR